MEKDSELTLDQRIRLAELFNSIPTSLLVSKKARLNCIKYDNVNLAEEAFKTSFESVIRKPFVAPKTHHSEVWDKPNERPVITKLPKVNIRGRQNLYLKWNGSLRRLNERENVHILVYEKITNKLRFSGDIIEAVDYIDSMERTKEWNETSWVIYIPKKLYDEVINV